ncbi:MAG: transporter [Myxococcota bacterium]|jgi:mono/diheme cytochrome c family protein|nr:transporter [Myxococcota bacterium]
MSTGENEAPCSNSTRTSDHSPRAARTSSALLTAFIVAGVSTIPFVATTDDSPEPGRALFEERCALCHGLDGKGAPENTGIVVPRPDFTDCAFASREADADWGAVATDGGPARGFSPLMPAHRDLLTPEQIQLVLDHVRGFCSDDRWPRGELNLPRPMFTEKAFPEDEAVITTVGDVNRTADEVSTELLFEKRIGPRAMVEIALPIESTDVPTSSGGEKRETGIGDLGLGAKYAFYHDLEAGFISSLGSEFKFPTGDDARGLGKGSVVYEPYLALGQIVASDGFAQVQLLGEIPTDRDLSDEVQLRTALGWTFTPTPHGRVFAPMVEIIGAWELQGKDEASWDIAPQIQIPLNRRQHVRLNVGARIPLTDSDTRPTRVGGYLLWDWYDGGLFDGW